MKPKPHKLHKKILDIKNNLNKNHMAIFDKIFSEKIDLPCYSISSKFRRAELLRDIIENNPKNSEYLYDSYHDIKDIREKLKVRYGTDRVKEYDKIMIGRPRPYNPKSTFSYDFWMQKGMTEIQAKQQVSDIQTKNVKKRTNASYKNFSKKLKFSLDYWTEIGYSVDEAEILRGPYLSECRNDLESLVARYGKDIGTGKWIRKCERYKDSMVKARETQKSGGYVSKESLNFFIPLYKFCRRLGIKREQINIGMHGSREFFIRDNLLVKNGGRFYDFTIRNIKFIVEYNGTFWHPRTPQEWKNPWGEYQTVLDSDNYKKKLANDIGMEYIVVWSDDNKKEKMAELQNKISCLWKEYYEHNK
jgi:hypothetical protein